MNDVERDLSQVSVTTMEAQATIGRLVLENQALRKRVNELILMLPKPPVAAVAEQIIKEAQEQHG